MQEGDRPLVSLLEVVRQAIVVDEAAHEVAGIGAESDVRDALGWWLGVWSGTAEV